MRYSDLIQFEPIEAVIQPLDANRPQEARKLVALNPQPPECYLRSGSWISVLAVTDTRLSQ